MRVLPVVIVLGTIGLASCSDKSRRNLVLISIDTLRADYVGCYGDSEATPNIDALAAEGVRFDNVVSPIPLTLPAHSTMLTGRIPPSHGIHDNLSYRLGDAELTLAELLKDNGYTTGAIVSSFVLDSEFNLSQGFDTYNDAFEEEHKIAFLSERKGDEATRFATSWLAARGDEPFFLFLHYYDPHDDYESPEPFASRFPGDPYAGEVAFVDHQVGQVIEKLKALGRYDTTLVVVTADHGEMLEEHGELNHGYFIYEPAIRIPLVIRAPGIEPRVVTDRVGLVDVSPTLAGLLGLGFPTTIDGKDLSDIVRGQARPGGGRREYFSESLSATRYYGAASLFGLSKENWKYIHTTRPELYDLARDPFERENVVEQHPDIAEGMRQRLEAILSVEPPQTTTEAELDEEARRRLVSLGYLRGGSIGQRPELESLGDDPKDWITFYREHQRLEKLVQNEAYDEARRLGLSLIERNPSFGAGFLQLARIATETGDLTKAAEYYGKAIEIEPPSKATHFNLANILQTLGRADEAAIHYRKAIELDPSFTRARTRLADVLLETGHTEEAIDGLREVAASSPESSEAIMQLGAALASRDALDEAAAHFRRALEIEPSSAAAHLQLANVLDRQGKLEEAIVHYRRALELDPNRAELVLRLARAVRRQGKLGEALELLNRAVALDPELAIAHNDLGLALKEMGRLDDAMRHYRRAIEIEPGLADAHNNVGSLLGSRGDVREAISHFRRAIAADPNHAEAHNNLALALRMTGARDEARPHFEAALALRPDWPAPMNELAWILATHPNEGIRNPEKALSLARRAAELTGERQPVVLDTLAAALAANANYAAAVEVAERAASIAFARAPGLANEIRERLVLYRDGRPFVEATSMRASPRR